MQTFLNPRSGLHEAAPDPVIDITDRLELKRLADQEKRKAEQQREQARKEQSPFKGPPGTIEGTRDNV